MKSIKISLFLNGISIDVYAPNFLFVCFIYVLMPNTKMAHTPKKYASTQVDEKNTTSNNNNRNCSSFLLFMPKMIFL